MSKQDDSGSSPPPGQTRRTFLTSALAGFALGSAGHPVPQAQIPVRGVAQPPVAPPPLVGEPEPDLSPLAAQAMATLAKLSNASREASGAVRKGNSPHKVTFALELHFTIDREKAAALINANKQSYQHFKKLYEPMTEEASANEFMAQLIERHLKDTYGWKIGVSGVRVGGYDISHGQAMIRVTHNAYEDLPIWDHDPGKLVNRLRDAEFKDPFFEMLREGGLRTLIDRPDPPIHEDGFPQEQQWLHPPAREGQPLTSRPAPRAAAGYARV